MNTPTTELAATIPATMRALVLSGTGFAHLALKTLPTPSPGPQQLLARVDAAGICTSLLKLIEQGPKHSYLAGWDPALHPLILGEEGSVTLVAVGEALRGRYGVGQRYVIQPAVDHPPINHRGRYHNHGVGMHKVGVGYTLPGHLAEYILIPEEVIAAHCLLPLPDPGIPYAHAAMTEPLSCVVSAQEHHLHLTQQHPSAERGVTKGLKPGGVTLIVGAGVMGRMHVDLALSYRPRAIVVSDFVPERLARTRTLFEGAAKTRGVALHTLEAHEVHAFVDHVTDHHGADDVIVAVGAAEAVEAAQQHTARGAVLNLFGGLKKGEDVVPFDTGRIHYQEVIVTGSSGGSPWDVARVLGLIHTGDLEAGTHITRIGDLAHAPALLEQVRAQALDGKAVVYPYRPSKGILQVDGWTADDERAYLQAGP